MAATGEFSDDRIHSGSPHEWFGILVPSGQKFIDSGNKIVDAEERIAANALIGQFSKPALNQIEPTATSGHVMNDIARMLFEPRFHRGMPMSSVVVHHQVQSCLAWKLAIDVAQKLEELLMTVSLVKITDDFSLQHIRGGKQGSRSVPLVIVGHGSTTALLQRKTWLSAV